MSAIPNIAKKRVLVVDGDPMMFNMLRTVLSNEGLEVIHASSGEEAFDKAVRQTPRVIIADVVLPGMDGYALCRRLRQTPITSSIPIVLLTAKSDIADKIMGFQAGADDYVTKPFQPEEIVYRIKGIMARAPLPDSTALVPLKQGRIIATFGSKGGVGKTMIATNFALALKRRSGKQVALMDADLAFGDANVHLNVPPGRSVLDMAQAVDALSAQFADNVLAVHSSGLRVLLCPPHPEDAELISAEHVQRILTFLSGLYDYVVVDCGANYDDRTLTILERADDVLLIVTPEIGPLRNAVLFLSLADKLGMDRGKIQIVLNRANSQVGIEEKDIQQMLRHKVGFRLASGGRITVMSVNRGIPLVLDKPDHPLAQQITSMADAFVKAAQPQAA